jgi:hypothetical protein
MSDYVVPFRGGLSRAVAERRIREIAADTAALDFPWSAAKQMAAAEITMRQVIETLRTGAVVENPVKSERGDWICVLRKRIGGRNVHAMVALSEDRPLTIIAVR